MDHWVLPQINFKCCDGCGLCSEYCPTHAIIMSGALPEWSQPGNCSYCGICEDMCPRGAIELRYEITLSDPGNPSILLPLSS